MKRISLFLFFLLGLGLMACSDDDDDPNPDNQNDNPGPVECIDGLKITPADSQPDTLCNADYNGELKLTNSPDKAVDYFVPRSIDFEDGSKLTVESGTVISFSAGTKLTIQQGSEVHMNGTANSPITLRGETETPGFWNAVVLLSGNVTNNLTHVTIQNAGSDDLDDFRMALYISKDGRAKIQDCTFRDNDGHGLVAVDGARLPDFQRNNFIENTLAPIAVAHNAVHYLDTESSFSNNAEAYVMVANSLQNCCPPDELEGDHTWVFNQLPLRMTGLLTDAGDKLTLEKGVHIQVSGDNQLTFNGSLIINGSMSDSVRIEGATQAQGAWQGIYLRKENSSYDWNYVSIGHGGSQTMNTFHDTPANIYLDNDVTLDISNASVHNSGNAGISFEQGGSGDAFLNATNVNYYANADGDAVVDG